MKATVKSEGIEALLTNITGADRRETIAQNVCLPKPIGCGGAAIEFRDALSRKEYTISGLCQRCQDDVFKSESPEPVSIGPEPSKVGIQDDDVFIVDKPYRMFSGAAEAAKFVYRKLMDRDGKVWLYPINSDTPAEQVHFHDPRDLRSDGYGGSTLNFALEDGSVYAAKGPWHSNAGGMFAATGTDIRNTHRTYGCVARRRIYKNHIQEFHSILHADTEAVIGSFDRLKLIAQEWADKLGHPVACYRESKGGSSSGWEIPTGTDWKKWTDWFQNQ